MSLSRNNNIDEKETKKYCAGQVRFSRSASTLFGASAALALALQEYPIAAGLGVASYASNELRKQGYEKCMREEGRYQNKK